MDHLLVCLLTASACGGAPPPPVRTTVFDPTAAAASVSPIDVGAGTAQLEVSYPPFDRPDTSPGGSSRTGVTVLRGGVRFSRPVHWMIRDASVDPGRAYITYVSPRAYSFAIYERSDAPTDPWRDVLERYEGDIAAAGAKATGQRVPVATGTNQGRAYTVERAAPAFSRSREYLLRSEHRIVLVQIVTQDPDLSRIGPELLEVLGGLEVL